MEPGQDSQGSLRNQAGNAENITSPGMGKKKGLFTGNRPSDVACRRTTARTRRTQREADDTLRSAFQPTQRALGGAVDSMASNLKTAMRIPGPRRPRFPARSRFHRLLNVGLPSFFSAMPAFPTGKAGEP